MWPSGKGAPGALVRAEWSIALGESIQALRKHNRVLKEWFLAHMDCPSCALYRGSKCEAEYALYNSLRGAGIDAPKSIPDGDVSAPKHAVWASFAAIDRCSRQHAHSIFDPATAEPRIEAALELRRRLASGTASPLAANNDSRLLVAAGLQEVAKST